MFRALLILLCILGCTTWAGAAWPANKEVVVERRDGTFTIRPDGDVAVVETWKVRFVGGPFRYAFRAIPLKEADEIDSWSIVSKGLRYAEADDERAGTFHVRRSGEERKITWYFEPTTDQVRTFVLQYTLHGALRMGAPKDELLWEFIEADRDCLLYTSDAADE